MDHFLIPNNDTFKDPILATLNVSNNKIRTEGGRSIGRMLWTNTSLISLDVSLNRLEDEGGQLLLDGLRHNCTLKILNISSNELRSKSVAVLSKILEEEDPSSSLLETNHICISSLEEVDISSNQLSDADVVQLSNAVKVNKKLFSFDLRRQGMKEDGKYVQPTQVYERAVASIHAKLQCNENEILSS